MTFKCPHGHDSTDDDYCSECGAPIQAGSIAASVAAAPLELVPTASVENDDCPDCGTPHTPGSRFCEVCRYDFDTKTSNTDGADAQATPVVQLPTNPFPTPASVPPSPVNVSAAIPDRLSVTITADESLYLDKDPAIPFPADTPARVFHLDLEENLVGRVSIAKNIHPEIPVSDVGVSSRHLKLFLEKDGHWMALELGSSNGTLFNGQPLLPGAAKALQVGDTLTLGMWTRLTIGAR